MKYAPIILLLSLSSCFSAKISHKSQFKADDKDKTEKSVKSAINEAINTHTVEQSVDTSVKLSGGYDAGYVQVVHDTFCLDKNLKSISIVKTVKNATAKAIYEPKTGMIYLSLNVRDTAISVRENRKETTVFDTKKSNIDSSLNHSTDKNVSVKGQTSVGVSLFQSPMMTCIYCGIALLIGIFIGKKIKSKS